MLAWAHPKCDGHHDFRKIARIHFRRKTALPCPSALPATPDPVGDMHQTEQAGEHQRYLTDGEQQVHGILRPTGMRAGYCRGKDGQPVLQGHRKRKQGSRSAG